MANLKLKVTEAEVAWGVGREALNFSSWTNRFGNNEKSLDGKTMPLSPPT